MALNPWVAVDLGLEGSSPCLVSLLNICGLGSWLPSGVSAVSPLQARSTHGFKNGKPVVGHLKATWPGQQ